MTTRHEDAKMWMKQINGENGQLFLLSVGIRNLENASLRLKNEVDYATMKDTLVLTAEACLKSMIDIENVINGYAQQIIDIMKR